MAITESFRKASATCDVSGIRIMMKDSLLVDPTFGEFKEMENLAKGVDGLYDPHDGRELNPDKTAWNDDYMNKLMVQVVGNFSHERINHLKDVVFYLRPVAPRSQTSASSRSYTRHESSWRSAEVHHPNSHQQKQKNEHNNQTVDNRGIKIATGAIGGGVAGGVAAAVIGTSVFLGCMLGAVSIGIVTAVVTNEGE